MLYQGVEPVPSQTTKPQTPFKPVPGRPAQPERPRNTGKNSSLNWVWENILIQFSHASLLIYCLELKILVIWDDISINPVAVFKLVLHFWQFEIEFGILVWMLPQKNYPRPKHTLNSMLREYEELNCFSRPNTSLLDQLQGWKTSSGE